ncbi:PD-(D/E)XK nuclease family protein [Parabacteroides sp. AGMB00274]|uniref:PD-(D/E)XK nuclease family protein n=1 Tax=Parabacteroides faecalis TaxID=2924040 RepID=A0ABT0C3D4_9BACT|nr:PD-(D/E)XK nuclease family protein [Parabacteroides faecalis]MCJ2381529.1 PD-(D/E)XK nuclease family protein [Parabacteroides faecalis]
MKPFLYQVATLFYQQYGAEIHRLAFVFPNRRAGLFFQKYLSEISEKPLFSPSILTINDLFMQLSGKHPADKIQMLFRLYELYKQRSGSSESFDEFIYWGEMLLNDFDDIDKYMVDARMLFRNVSDLKSLDDDFNYLSPEQVQAIRSFWSSFYPKGDSPNQQHFLELWEILYDLYAGLRTSLVKDGCGYDGMIFREVVEQLEKESMSDFPFDQVVFVGLNALSVSEERLLLALQKKGVADFYWDYVGPWVTDPDNKASFFLERNLRLFPSRMELPATEPVQAEIRVMGVPSAIGQAKQVYPILQALADEQQLTDESALRTAIVLPDEHLLVPVLNAIPEAIQHINVTMGYPLTGTPVAALMEYILTLQKNIRYIDRVPVFYFRDVLPILNHQYVMAAAPEEVSQLVKDMTAGNRIYVHAADLNRHELLSILFTPVQNTEELSDYLIHVLEALNACLRNNRPNPDDEEMISNSTQTTADIEQEFIFHYFATVNRMKEVMREAKIEMRLDTYFRLLKRMTDLIMIPFEGEPLSGLQVMGVLETRALDFDRLIILSMNEGIFPLKKAANSFIPYNLRRGFGLPTYEHQDSVWAYHFYRLIRRAKQVTLLYDTRTTGLQTGEVSRFVHQLRYHYQSPLIDELVVYDVASSAVPPISVQKTAEVEKLLSDFLSGGPRALSASAINTYLDCPLKFYFSVLEQIQEEDEITETVERDVFGSILHKVMEDLYAPFKGKLVTADLLKLLRKDQPLLTGTIARAFAELFFKSPVVRPLEGENFLTGEMIRKYAEKILEQDARFTPFHYIESEKKVRATITLSDKRVVQLKGFIDRVDSLDRVLRIVDYKTGSGKLEFESVEGLFDKEAKDRPKAVMQVFLYAWMYQQLPEYTGMLIQPAIYYLRTLFQRSFNPVVEQKKGRGKADKVNSFQDFASDFEDKLRQCLDEIFNLDIPFTQTETGKACAYCSFRGLCGK